VTGLTATGASPFGTRGCVLLLRVRSFLGVPSYCI